MTDKTLTLGELKVIAATGIATPEEVSLICQKFMHVIEERDADKKRIADMNGTIERECEKSRRMASSIAELEARTVSVKFPDGWHFEECETEGCQNGAIFSVGKAANNIHLCEACTKDPVYARFTKTALQKRLPFNLAAAGIKLEVGE